MFWWLGVVLAAVIGLVLAAEEPVVEHPDSEGGGDADSLAGGMFWVIIGGAIAALPWIY